MSVLLKHKYGMSIFLVLSIPCFSTLSLANPVKSSDVFPYGRYLTLKTQPSVEQTDMLSVVIEVHFSPVIKTVGDALNDIVRYSGYSLVDTAKQSLELQNTLKNRCRGCIVIWGRCLCGKHSSHWPGRRMSCVWMHSIVPLILN